MAEDDAKRAAWRALVERILDGPGQAPAGQRARAFGNDGLPAPLDALADKVATGPAAEADLAAATAAGLSEDQVFELVVCAAVGQSSRLYDAGLAALAEATDGRPGSAS
jgi:alkylhydroperoxidase family enzyme